MFQTFESESDPTVGARARRRGLREWLAAKELDGFLVPRADQHQGEYVAPGSERLRWLTGFAGSAGVALILRDRAISSSTAATRCRCATRPTCRSSRSRAWSRRRRRPGSRRTSARARASASIRGCTRSRDVKALRKAAEKVGAELVRGRAQPDRRAVGRPARRRRWRAIEIHPIEYAGELAKDKLARLAAELAKEGVAHAVLTDPSSVAWAFNIRGSDVPHTPLALGFAVLSAEGPHLLFIDKRKLAIETEAYLTQLADLRAASALDAEMARLAKGGAKIALDPALAAEQAAVAGRPRTAARSSSSPTLPACRAPPRTAPRSPARAPRTAATARPWPRCCAGSTARRRARSTRSPR